MFSRIFGLLRNSTKIAAQQKWSSCAAAVFGGVAVALSGGVPGASRLIKRVT